MLIGDDSVLFLLHRQVRLRYPLMRKRNLTRPFRRGWPGKKGSSGRRCRGRRRGRGGRENMLRGVGASLIIRGGIGMGFGGGR
jgi:hypothetical protein